MSQKEIYSSNIIAHVFRLLPGQDLYKEIENYGDTYKDLILLRTLENIVKKC